MSMYCNQLALEVAPVETTLTVVPMATEADFDLAAGLFPEVGLFSAADSDSYAYFNADSCPDCGAGMIRQGRCCACPSCGYESCLAH